MMYQAKTFVGLEDLQSQQCQLHNNYHGELNRSTQQIHPRFAIYTCLGEALNEPELRQKLLELSESFVIIPTVRTYPSIAHETDRYEIITIPSAYSWYSQVLATANLVSEDKKITKKILSLNNRGQWPRQALLQFLINFDLLDQCYFSYHCMDINGIGTVALFRQLNEVIGRTWFNNSIDVDYLLVGLPYTIDKDQFNEKNESLDNGYADLPGNVWSYSEKRFYLDSFCSVVTETYIDENWDPFFTEKIFKPFAYGHPFMVHSSAGALRLLRQLGFETFPEIFDESYDGIESPQQRFDHILREIQRICNFSVDDLQSLYRSLIPKLLHNQHVFREFLPRQYNEDIQRVKSQIKHIIDRGKNT